ncbi:MAG: metal-dependent transcriptional regulator, partial [Pisciglobus halotolerans]|nr:metal-dependent transcriptional regulator [Pisciglobus halotolerans]
AKEASILVRKHRLWEVFLVEKLNFQWNDVHQEAEVLEHATSDELANRLEAFLNYPKHCPHGGAIPEEKGAFPEQHHQNLTEFVVGDVVNIKRVLDEKELLDYLVSIGLEVGKEYCVVHYSDYQGPIFLKDNERSIQISYKAALNIFAEK